MLRLYGTIFSVASQINPDQLNPVTHTLVLLCPSFPEGTWTVPSKKEGLFTNAVENHYSGWRASLNPVGLG